jgi:hypothetical protein
MPSTSEFRHLVATCPAHRPLLHPFPKDLDGEVEILETIHACAGCRDALDRRKHSRRRSTDAWRRWIDQEGGPERAWLALRGVVWRRRESRCRAIDAVLPSRPSKANVPLSRPRGVPLPTVIAAAVLSAGFAFVLGTKFDPTAAPGPALVAAPSFVPNESPADGRRMHANDGDDGPAATPLDEAVAKPSKALGSPDLPRPPEPSGPPAPDSPTPPERASEPVPIAAGSTPFPGDGALLDNPTEDAVVDAEDEVSGRGQGGGPIVPSTGRLGVEFTVKHDGETTWSESATLIDRVDVHVAGLDRDAAVTVCVRAPDQTTSTFWRDVLPATGHVRGALPHDRVGTWEVWATRGLIACEAPGDARPLVVK